MLCFHFSCQRHHHVENCQEEAEVQTFSLNLGGTVVKILFFVLNYNHLMKDNADYTEV